MDSQITPSSPPEPALAGNAPLRSRLLPTSWIAGVLQTLGLRCGCEVSRTAQLQVLWEFRGRHDGASPLAGLAMDAKANLYGTTASGGPHGGGTVFKLTPQGEKTAVHAFSGANDGLWPQSRLAIDALGNLYGTTSKGGNRGAGVVFCIAPRGACRVLHAFGGGQDGYDPHSGLMRDTNGQLYGTTAEGGAYGYGTVFRTSVAGDKHTLYSFTGAGDGASPQSGLVADAQGNLYGTTPGGGTHGKGTVYRVTPTGQLRVLWSFAGGHAGAHPKSGLVIDPNGHLCGTTFSGGGHGAGTVFRLILTPSTELQTLWSFGAAKDGAYPKADLCCDARGNLYGTTTHGGAHDAGTVFALSADGTMTVLWSFDPERDGTTPSGSLLIDASGALYGTTSKGGKHGAGTVFRLQP